MDRLAVLMIRTGREMLLWCFPDGPVAEAVNTIRDLPDRLERLVQVELDSPIEEML